MSMAALESNGSPFATTRVSLVSASGKRMHPRVDHPLTIGFADGRYREATDWSISGFSLTESDFAAVEGSIHRVGLVIPLAGCSVMVEADAKVTRVAGCHARGFRFVGLPADKARIIDHFIQSGVDGDAAVIGGLPVTRRDNGDMAPNRGGRFRRNLGQAIKLVILAGAVLGGGAVVAARMLTVTADYAAVSADLRQLHAPEAGYLVGDRLKIGARLRAGERIGSVQPVAGPQARLSTQTQIAALQTGLDQQKLTLEQAKAGFATFLQATRTDFIEAEANRQMLEAQVASQNETYGRLLSLRAKDVVNQQRIDEESRRLLDLQRALSAARGLEETARQKLVNAESGRFASDGRTTQKSPADLQQDIDTTQETIRRLQTMLAGLDTPLVLTSPCDCTVAAVAATPGSFVLSGTRIADLVENGDESVTTIDALVQNARLNLVRQGQAVTVYLADRPDALAGHVETVNFNPADTGRAGLPPSLRTLDDYGLMTVRLDQPIERPEAGLPASVMVPTNWATLAAKLPVVRWGQEIVEDAAAKVPTLLESVVPATAAKTSVLPRQPV